MRESQRLGHIAAVVVLLTAGALRGDCVQTVRSVSQLGAFPNLVAGPIATNGSNVLVGKSDVSTSTPAVYVATYDTDLNQILPDRQIAAASAYGPTALIYADTPTPVIATPPPKEFGLFFQRTDATLMLQRLDANGNPIGSPIPMPHSWGFNDEFDIAWDKTASAYAIAHSVTGGFDLGIWLTLVSTTGTTISDLNLSVFASVPSNVHVAALLDGSAAVMWSGRGSPAPTFVTFAKNGSQIGVTTISNRAVTNARMATNGASILVVYQAAKSGGGTELRAIVISAAGAVTTADSSYMSGSGDDIAPLTLQWNSVISEWALVYADAFVGFNNNIPPDARLRRFSSLSATPSDTLLSPDLSKRSLTAAFPVVFVGNGYVASIARVVSTTQGGESYLVRLCPLVAVAHVDPAVARPFQVVTLTGSASGGTPGYTFTWQFGDNSSGAGTVVTHRFSPVGTYTVTLTARDAAGATAMTTTTVVISDVVRGRAARH